MLKSNRMQRFMKANTSAKWILPVLVIKIQFQCFFPGFEKKTFWWPTTIEPCFFN